jgi:hypothetical protein
MWLLEFLFGMFLAYLLLSPRLRHFLFCRNHTSSIQNRVEAEEKREQRVSLPPIPNRNGHELKVNDATVINKWLSDNPELEKINRKVKARILS